MDDGLMKSGWMDEWIKWLAGWMDGWMGWMDGWMMDRWTHLWVDG
jgi:hypothetical protein